MPTFSESDQSLATKNSKLIDGDLRPPTKLGSASSEPLVSIDNNGAVSTVPIEDDAKAGERPTPGIKHEVNSEKYGKNEPAFSMAKKIISAFRPFWKGFYAPFFIALLVVWWFVVLWIVLYSAHIIIPSSVLPYDVGSYKERFFYGADVLFGRQRPRQYDFRENSVQRASEVWIDKCLFSDLDRTQKPTNSKDLLYWNSAQAAAGHVSAFSEDLAYKSQRYWEELDQFRSKSVWYASILIVLGMLTTIVSALNSSQFGSGTNFSASTIKIFAIILPALATAITAYSSLNAPTDATSMRSQLIYNVASLGAQMTADLNQLGCKSRIEIEKLHAKISDWNMKYADTIVGIELSQGRSKSGGNLDSSSNGNGQDKNEGKGSEGNDTPPPSHPLSSN